MYAYFRLYTLFFFFKQKPAYELRISDWSSDVCSSDLFIPDDRTPRLDSDRTARADRQSHFRLRRLPAGLPIESLRKSHKRSGFCAAPRTRCTKTPRAVRSEEQTSELQSLMRTSYAVFSLKPKKKNPERHAKYTTNHTTSPSD